MKLFSKAYFLSIIIVSIIIIGCQPSTKVDKVSQEKTEMDYKSMNPESSADDTFPMAAIIGPLEVKQEQKNIWSAVFTSPDEEAVEYQWFQREEGEPFWDPVGTGDIHYETVLEVLPRYLVHYEMKVEITTDAGQTITSLIHDVDAAYDPGWSGCGYVSGPDCDGEGDNDDFDNDGTDNIYDSDDDNDGTWDSVEEDCGSDPYDADVDCEDVGSPGGGDQL